MSCYQQKEERKGGWGWGGNRYRGVRHTISYHMISIEPSEIFSEATEGLMKAADREG